MKSLWSIILGVIFAGSIFVVNVPHASAHDTGAPHNHPDDALAIDFKNPLKKDTVEGILNDVLVAIQGIVGVLAVLFIVVGAILYITSGGNSSRIELAKMAVWAALIGLAIALAAPSFLREIYEALGAEDKLEGGAAGAPYLATIVLNFLRILLSFIGVLAITMLVVGGILYMSAAGDQGRIETAKRTVIFAVIGLTVALVSVIVINQIAGAFV